MYEVALASARVGLALEPRTHLGGDMSKQYARTIPEDRTRSHLEKKHAKLASRIEALDSRMSLTPNEELELHQLKKEKLWAKDALESVG